MRLINSISKLPYTLILYGVDETKYQNQAAPSKKKKPMNWGGSPFAFWRTPERNKIAANVNIPTGKKDVILAHQERYKM
jgi:hypothetical protein